MIVGCKLPHGMKIEHNGQTIMLNGTNVGYDDENPWRNGGAPDSADRTSGVGLTVLTGAQAEAMADWMAIAGQGDGPVQRGHIFAADKAADATKEAQALEGEKTQGDGLDPDKDLSQGLETAKD